MKNDSSKSDAMSSGKEKTRRKIPLKIVLRRLPASMTWEQLETQLSPIPEFEFSEFIAAKSSKGTLFSRVYFVFKNDDDVIAFKERFHGYVFVDDKGGESVGIVELAPNPKIPHDRLETAKERDFKCGTIETDHEYKKFLSERENPQIPNLMSLERMVKEIEEREKMAEKMAVQETPLTQYLIRKSMRRIEEKRRLREEEKRQRMERRYESELKDKQERQEVKKVTEFRNSKYERSHENSVKEKERAKIRTYRSGDYNRNGTVEKWCDNNDRDKCIQPSKKKLDASAGIKTEKSDELEREKKTGKEDETVPNNLISSADIVGSKSSDKSSNKIAKIVNRTPAQRTTAIKKDEKNPDNGKEKEKTENFTKPRRNKDRPERAIYQPSAIRRRGVTLSARDSDATEKMTSASKDKP